MRMDHGFMARRAASGLVDWAIEFAGGVLGSYFGAIVAALFVAMKDGPAEQMQSSIWSGFGFGFVFWTLSISFLNRVLIQGLSRSSIGKKVFNLEIISVQGPLSWTKVTKRWVLSFVSFATGGAGYWFSFFNAEGQSFHDFIAHTDIIPLYEGRTVSVEHRPEVPMTLTEIRQMMVLSNVQAERPTATIIHLPVREQVAATGTDNRPIVMSENIAVAPVIDLKKKFAEEETDELKKAA